MAFNQKNQNGLKGLYFKRSSFGLSHTCWMKETKKSNVYKYTIIDGGKTYTLLLDLNMTARSYEKGNFFPLKILCGEQSGIGGSWRR